MKTPQCHIPGCNSPIFAKGLCSACYAWDHYHMTNRHGIQYMVKYSRKVNRLAERADIRLSQTNVRALRRRRRA